MSEEKQGYEVARLAAPTEAQLVESIDYAERANVDVQVLTAHQFPRDLSRCINNAVTIATMDEETAKSCGYALPRGNKPITGPSVHLAKIIAQQYGNLRVEARVVNVTATQVVSRGTAWDLENNYAVAFEVRRSIMGKNGRYNDDMITVTGNAANSIAYRNAVFALVPKAITDKVYTAAQHLITGDLSDDEKLLKRRNMVVKGFIEHYGITEEEVVKMCGRYTINQIRADEIAFLLGVAQSLKDGDTTVEELMSPFRQSKEAKKNKLNNIVRNTAIKTESTDVAEVVDATTGEVTNG